MVVRHSREMKEKVFDLAEAGRNSSEIAAATGLNTDQVRGICFRADVSLKQIVSGPQRVYESVDASTLPKVLTEKWG